MVCEQFNTLFLAHHVTESAGDVPQTEQPASTTQPAGAPLIISNHVWKVYQVVSCQQQWRLAAVHYPIQRSKYMHEPAYSGSDSHTTHATSLHHNTCRAAPTYRPTDSYCHNQHAVMCMLQGPQLSVPASHNHKHVRVVSTPQQRRLGHTTCVHTHLAWALSLLHVVLTVLSDSINNAVLPPCLQRVESKLRAAALALPRRTTRVA